MRFVLTHCPRCHAFFYVESESRTKVHTRCPYCRFDFSDKVRPGQVKEVDYYWELYSGLYPPLKDRYGGSKVLKGSGLLLLFTLPAFMLGIFNLISPSHLAGLGVQEQSIRAGLALAIIIFSTFVVGGSWSSLKRYSFPISTAGSLFGLLNSILLWLFFYLDFFLEWTNGFKYLIYIAFFLSMTSLLIVIRQRWNFTIGY